MVELRPEVRAFAEAMQRLLDEHQDEKGDAWKAESSIILIDDLFHRVRVFEATERDVRLGLGVQKLTDVCRGAASVAVHAMFVADVMGALDTTGDA